MDLKQLRFFKKKTEETEHSEKKPTAFVRFASRFPILLNVVLAVLINFFIEAVSRHSVGEAWQFLTGSPLVFFYNAFMIFITLWICFFFRRRTFVRFLISVLWCTLGIVNGLLLLNRVTPFNGADLKVALDAVTLIHQYLSTVQIALCVLGVVAAVLLVIMVFRITIRSNKRPPYVPVALGMAVNIFLFIFLTNAAIDARVLSNYFGNIAFAYQDYGLPYCFYSSVFKTGIDKPDGYSEETMNRITENGAYLEVGSETDEYPNIIFVQLESFFDPTEVEGLELSEDPIPNMRKLMGQYSSGYFKVPSVGAGTANTEFEVLTGMSMRYFGPGEYPYKTIMKQTTCESAAYALENFGYSTHALHNNGGNFYSRAEVFGNMGFDSYTSKEFMNILEYTEMGWAKDDILIRYMDQALDSSEQQDFLFTITVQGHGSYPQEQMIQDPRIQVTAIEDESMRYAWEYFVNQQYEVDQFIGNLVHYLDQRGEDTVLVLYGDHLPTMGLQAEDLKNRYLYNTEYVIWDNIGLEKQDQNLFAYQIMAEVMDQIGLHAGTVFNYHQNRRGTKDLLVDLELLQYDILYGDRFVYGGDNPFEPQEIEMGLVDTTIDELVIDDDGSITLIGTNFTSWSKIYINDNKYKTVFINDGRIQTERTGIELEDGDEIFVGQVGSKNTIFRRSEIYTVEIEEAETEEDIPPIGESDLVDEDINPDTNGMERENPGEEEQQ